MHVYTSYFTAAPSVQVHGILGCYSGTLVVTLELGIRTNTLSFHRLESNLIPLRRCLKSLFNRYIDKSIPTYS